MRLSIALIDVEMMQKELRQAIEIKIELKLLGTSTNNPMFMMMQLRYSLDYN